MRIPEILRYVERYRDEGRKAFVTSSFQSHSIALLHILSRAAPEIPVVFINTGYHFPETIVFRDRVTRLLGLSLIDLRTSVDRSQQRDADGHFFFASNPDTCCFINKVQPLEAFSGAYDVWINGVRADQSDGRWFGMNKTECGLHTELVSK